MLKLNKDQVGAVAIITVIFIAIILSIITLGFIRLSVNEQRQSTDDDLSARAYYAAEAGVEDAKRDIKLYLDGVYAAVDLNGDSCALTTPTSNKVQSGDADLAQSYTCQLVDLDPESFQAYVPRGESLQIPLRTTTGSFESVEISWHSTSGDLSDGPYNLRTADKSLLSESDWNNPVNLWPAMIRNNFMSFTSGENRAGVMANNFVTFLNPALLANRAYNLPELPDNPIINGDCQLAVSAGPYACTVTIGGFNNGRSHYLRLKSLYRDSHIQIRLLDGGGNPLQISDAQAAVDVTGRAGDVFRRIEVRVPLTDNTEFSLIPDFAIESAEDICKNFYLTDDGADYAVVNPNVESGTTCDPTR